MWGHLQLLAHVDGTRFYILRGFDEPLGEIDPETGQPFKDFRCAVNLIVKDGCAEVCAAVAPIPDEAIEAIRTQVVPELGLKEVFWWRWRKKKKRKFILPLNKTVRRLS